MRAALVDATPEERASLLKDAAPEVMEEALVMLEEEGVKREEALPPSAPISDKVPAKLLLEEGRLDQYVEEHPLSARRIQDEMKKVEKRGVPVASLMLNKGELAKYLEDHPESERRIQSEIKKESLLAGGKKREEPTVTSSEVGQILELDSAVAATRGKIDALTAMATEGQRQDSSKEAERDIYSRREQYAAQILAKYDVNQNGRLDSTEFTRVLQQLEPDVQHANVLETFQQVGAKDSIDQFQLSQWLTHMFDGVDRAEEEKGLDGLLGAPLQQQQAKSTLGQQQEPAKTSEVDNHPILSRTVPVLETMLEEEKTKMARMQAEMAQRFQDMEEKLREEAQAKIAAQAEAKRMQAELLKLGAEKGFVREEAEVAVAATSLEEPGAAFAQVGLGLEVVTAEVAEHVATRKAAEESVMSAVAAAQAAAEADGSLGAMDPTSPEALTAIHERLAQLEAQAEEEETRKEALVELNSRLATRVSETPLSLEEAERRHRLTAWDPDAFLRQKPAIPNIPGAMRVKASVVVEMALDFICPWCYVAYKRLDRAIAALPAGYGDRVGILARPFFLQPEVPYAATRSAAFEALHTIGPAMAARFGRSGTLLERATTEVGIFINSDRVMGNTMQAHRLTALATERGQHKELIEAVFRAHIEGGRDISQSATLIQCGGMAGLHRREVEVFLQGGQGIEKLREREIELKRIGLTGVPAFFLWCPGAAVDGLKQPLFVHGNHEQQTLTQLIRDLLDHVDSPRVSESVDGTTLTSTRSPVNLTVNYPIGNEGPPKSPPPRARPGFLLR